jgi:membrane protein implicated in regulation of membrane protease activity
VPPTPERPRFPSSALNYWLGTFCAAVALLTLWVLPIGLTGQVAATALFVLVALTLLAFWLGQASERRAHRKDEAQPNAPGTTSSPIGPE